MYVFRDTDVPIPQRRCASSVAVDDRLLQTFHYMEVGERPVISVDACFSIRGEQDGPDRFHSGMITRHQLFHGSFSSRGQVQPRDFGRKLSGAVNEVKAPAAV